MMVLKKQTKIDVTLSEQEKNYCKEIYNTLDDLIYTMYHLDFEPLLNSPNVSCYTIAELEDIRNFLGLFSDDNLQIIKRY